MPITKTSTFNVSRFLAHLRDVREEAVALLANEARGDIRKAYRFVLNPDEYTTTEYVETPRTAEDLRDELSVAAQAAYLQGATRKQIDYIVALAAKLGDFREVGYSALTKGRASMLIETMQKQLAAN